MTTSSIRMEQSRTSLFCFGDRITSASQWKVGIYDTKHGLTRYGFKIVSYSTVDKNGKTKMIAVDAHCVDNDECLCWGFNVDKNFFPCIVFTDSDPAMKAAIAKEWPDTTHFFVSYESVHWQGRAVVCNMLSLVASLQETRRLQPSCLVFAMVAGGMPGTSFLHRASTLSNSRYLYQSITKYCRPAF